LSEQDGTQSSTKQRRSRKTSTANQQNGKQAPAVLRPTHDDIQAWQNYWKEQGQPWRTEPEIDVERQKYLDERRNITSDIKQGIYPFKDIKLSRADVEWLLATHENGRGPVHIREEGQYKRNGLDLRGANLENVDLKRLPLARVRFGLNWDEWIPATQEQREMAGCHLKEANLSRAHLEGVYLNNAYMEKANCAWAYLEAANLANAHLEHAYLHEAHLEKALLRGAHLERCDLSGAYFDAASGLNSIYLSSEKFGIISLVDVSWGGANLSVVNWASVKMLGNELKAKKSNRLEDYQTAVRANRQLAVVLRDQGLNEEADRFAYRAQLLQRKVWSLQRKPLKYLFSWFLYLLAGYGYRPIRSVIWYLIIIFGFAAAYFAFGHLPPVPDAFVFSLTSFHGRGFFPGLGNETSLHNPLVVLAAIEAVVGLFIEISFIATFTQRFFGR
jgi:uncharacterized protein YjbI with pentapeptide repeats